VDDTFFLPGPGDGPDDNPFPPGDTVVTWCPYHRNSPAVWIDPATKAAYDVSADSPGDYVTVLFLDGSVKRVPAYDAADSTSPADLAAWEARVRSWFDQIQP